MKPTVVRVSSRFPGLRYSEYDEDSLFAEDGQQRDMNVWKNEILMLAGEVKGCDEDFEVAKESLLTKYKSMKFSFFDYLFCYLFMPLFVLIFILSILIANDSCKKL